MYLAKKCSVARRRLPRGGGESRRSGSYSANLSNFSHQAHADKRLEWWPTNQMIQVQILPITPAITPACLLIYLVQVVLQLQVKTAMK